MSNALYDKGRNKFATGDIHWKASGGDTIKCALLDSSYTPNLSADEFFAACTAAVVGTPQTMTLLDPAAGVCDANDVTFPAVSGNQVVKIVIYKWVTGNSDSPLIALIDTATGLPVTPNGGDITIQWDNGANKIFKL